MKSDFLEVNSLGLTRKQMKTMYPDKKIVKIMHPKNAHKHWFKQEICEICNFIQITDENEMLVKET